MVHILTYRFVVRKVDALLVPVQRAGERSRRHAARCGVGSVIQDGGRHCQTQGRQQGRCSRDLCATLTLAQPHTLAISQKQLFCVND